MSATTAPAPEDLSALRAMLSAYETHIRGANYPRFTSTVLLLPLSPQYARLLLRLDRCSLPKIAASLGAVGVLSGLAKTFAAGRGVCGWFVLLIFVVWLARRVSSPLIAVVASASSFGLLFVKAWTPGDLVSIAAIIGAGLYGADMPGWD